ncbi:phage gp6-like head-tail connector protein [Acinetobacter beijerinckii]|uniref:head-tail connector protein n=1 Tax=Acinetobacter beijerinckii TaxID=262668 RepID=UPI0023DDCBB9|nr:head-tail connector protein [Acinetobacter beijerinckii]MDF2418037.1 phage gp6-like head-tail connector protein [Acinetobacter beijerinckii]
MSDFLGLDLAKSHLRVVHTRDDAYIGFLIKAALKAVLNFIDFENWDEVKEKHENAVPDDLIHAALLILGDMYVNRAAQTDANLYINTACERLMFPNRKMGV